MERDPAREPNGMATERAFALCTLSPHRGDAELCRARETVVYSTLPIRIAPVIRPSAPDPTDESDDEAIQSLARGMEVLRAFGSNSSMTIAEAAKATGLTRAGARRILITFEKLGYVRSDKRHYTLTARILELGHGFLAQPLWQVTRPILLSVANALNETVSAGVLDGNDVRYVVRVRSSRLLHVELREGARMPAYASSIGRVLLASLPSAALERYLRHATFTRFTKFTIVDPDILRTRLREVREQGWSYVRDETEIGYSGVSVPLIGPAGQTIAALNVNSNHTPARTAKTTAVTLLREAAAAIRDELQRSSAQDPGRGTAASHQLQSWYTSVADGADIPRSA